MLPSPKRARSVCDESYMVSIMTNESGNKRRNFSCSIIEEQQRRASYVPGMERARTVEETTCYINDDHLTGRSSLPSPSRKLRHARSSDYLASKVSA